MQRGNIEDDLAQTLIRDSLLQTITSSPIDISGGEWGSNGGGRVGGTRNPNSQRKRSILPIQEQQHKTGGRGRARKRATLYNSLSSYHNKFLGFLTEEYKAEVRGKTEKNTCPGFLPWKYLSHCSKLHSKL